MGSCCCCCKKSKELKELEDELDMIVNQKRLLEMKVYKKSSDTESSSSFNLDENLKFIDYDLYTSLKIIETGFNLTNGDLDLYHELNTKIQSVANSSNEVRLAKYAEIRCQETDIQKKLMNSIQDGVKDFGEVVSKKFVSVEERIEKVESLLLNTIHFVDERQELLAKFKSIPNVPRKDLGQLSSILTKLEDIESTLRSIEINLPGLNLDPLFTLKLKDIDRSLISFSKTSIQSFSTFDSILGQSGSSDVSSLKSSELSFETYPSLFESLSKHINLLQSLENNKLQLCESQSLTLQLISMDELLNNHFTSSEQDKETSYSNLKRLSKSSFEFSYLSDSGMFEIETSKSLKQNLDVLEQKIRNYVKINNKQDKIIREITEKIALFDQVFDEIEIKFQEFVAAEVKDLNKIVANADSELKSILVKANEKLINYSQETFDFYQRLKSFLDKVHSTEDLQKVKNAVRDLQNKEIGRIKSEHQEKLNDISNKLDAAENEKILIQNTLSTSKSQLSMITTMKEDLFKTLNEKELLVANLKNSIASLEENLGQMSEDKDKLQEEVDDLQKELRECKKQLRNKEYEISELKESMNKIE